MTFSHDIPCQICSRYMLFHYTPAKPDTVFARLQAGPRIQAGSTWFYRVIKSLPRLQAGSGSFNILLQGYNLPLSRIKCTQPILIAFSANCNLAICLIWTSCVEVKWNSRGIKSNSMQQASPLSIFTRYTVFFGHTENNKGRPRIDAGLELTPGQRYSLNK